VLDIREALPHNWTRNATLDINQVPSSARRRRAVSGSLAGRGASAARRWTASLTQRTAVSRVAPCCVACSALPARSVADTGLALGGS